MLSKRSGGPEIVQFLKNMKFMIKNHEKKVKMALNRFLMVQI